MFVFEGEGMALVAVMVEVMLAFESYHVIPWREEVRSH